MESVLIGIRPEWCEKIANGEKTIEVRKTKPKIDTPFKCYIYCSCKKPKWENQLWVDKSHNEDAELYLANGKVFGEFICDKITKAEKGTYYILPASETQMDVIDYVNYADEKPVYGWHISNLVIYDNPKELSEFYTIRKCNSCNESGYEATACIYDAECKVPVQLTRPPQSWCYVWESEAENG